MEPSALLDPHPRYRLIERIGQGGMGEVFRAQDRLTGQVVALKRVRMPSPPQPTTPPRLAAPSDPVQTSVAACSDLNDTAIASTIDSVKQRQLTAESNGFDPLIGARSQSLRLHLTQEFRTLTSLRHPNIISVLDYGFDQDKQPYYIMELLDAATPLHEAARKADRSTQIGLLLQVLQALTYLHRRGILHRDPSQQKIAGRSAGCDNEEKR